MPADPPRSLLVGVAELLTEIDDRAEFDGTVYFNLVNQKRLRTAASSLRALEEVLATMPEADPLMSAPTKTMYMHTLDGKPAYYVPGRQVVFAQQGLYARKGVVLVASLVTIRAQQAASRAWRAKQGYLDRDDYGYVRVEVPRAR